MKIKTIWFERKIDDMKEYLFYIKLMYNIDLYKAKQTMVCRNIKVLKLNISDKTYSTFGINI